MNIFQKQYILHKIFQRIFFEKNRNAMSLEAHRLGREFRIFVFVFLRQAQLKKSKQIFHTLNKTRLNQGHKFMSGSSHIRCVLIDVEYQNCRQTLDVYLPFLFCLGKLNQN
jgi:hypothetical protein